MLAGNFCNHCKTTIKKALNSRNVHVLVCSTCPKRLKLVFSTPI